MSEMLISIDYEKYNELTIEITSSGQECLLNNSILDFLGDTPKTLSGIKLGAYLVDMCKNGDDNIKDLDLSNNTKLETLICFESGISELDLSNNPDIYEVECNLDTTIIGGDNIKYLTRY